MAIECVKCNKSMSRYDEYICCKMKCNRNYHLSCASVTVEDFVKTKQEGTVKDWVCLNCSKTITSLQNKPNDTNRFEEYLSLKIDEAVKNITATLLTSFQIEMEKLTNENKKLFKEIKGLKEILKSQIHTGEHMDSVSVDIERKRTDGYKKYIEETPKDSYETQMSKRSLTYAERVKKPTKEIFDKIYTEPKKTGENIQKGENSCNNALIMSSNKSQSVIKVDDRERNLDEFQTVRRRQKANYKSKTIKGSALSSNLKAIVKFNHVYVTRLDKTITVEDINKYLNEKGFAVVNCEKMNSKRPDIYSSFRVGVPVNDINKLKQADIWPVGAYVNTFFWRMKPPPETT